MRGQGDGQVERGSDATQGNPLEAAGDFNESEEKEARAVVFILMRWRHDFLLSILDLAAK